MVDGAKSWNFKSWHLFFNCEFQSQSIRKYTKCQAFCSVVLTYYTVTRIDVIFCYPDRVPLTHFVHRAKKVFSMWAWIFCWVFCATGIFRRCNGKVFEHRVGANPSDYETGVLPQRQCTLVCKTQRHSLCSLLGFSCRFCSYRKPNFLAVSGRYLPGFSGRICSYWQPNFLAVSGSYLPGFSGGICSYWQPNFPAVSVVTCRDFLALPFLAPEGWDFPAVSVVSGRDFPAIAFLAWVI